jgi:hypothetical protein
MAAVGNQPFELVVSAVSDAETEFTEALEGTDVTYGLYPFSGGAQMMWNRKRFLK